MQRLVGARPELAGATPRIASASSAATGSSSGSRTIAVHLLRDQCIRGHRSKPAVALASRSLVLITVPPELIGRGGLDPQVASGPNSRKKS